MRRFLIALAAITGIGGAMFAAVPASAACTPGSGDAVNACANIETTLSITGLTSSIDFGNVSVATPDTVTGAEAYSVTTNLTAGYVLTITGSDSGLNDTTGDNVPNTALMVDETGFSAGDYTFSPNETQPLQVGSDTGSGVDHYSENWTLDTPATSAPGAYTETFTYAVVAG